MQNEDRSVVKSVSNRVNNKINGVSAMGLGVSTSSRSNNDRGIALSQSSGSSTDSDRSCRHETIDCLTESEDENSDDEMEDKDLKCNESKCNQSLNNSLWELNNKGRFRDIIEATGVLDFSTLDMKDSSISQFIISLNESLANSEKELEKSYINECEEAQEEISRQLKIIGFLRRACEMKDLDAIDLVTRYITDENGRIEPSDSLLCSAAAHGCYTLCECLIEMGVNIDDRSTKNSFTPLMEASLQNYTDIVSLLWQNGADVNAKSVDADTALHLAASCGHIQVVKLLVQYNANIEEHNENGHTPLMKAACEGHIEVASFLIEHGAGVNHYSNEFKETALTLAAYKGQLDMVKFLLNNGANCNHKTEEMHTAFMEAAMGGHVDVGKLLLEIGVQVNMPPDSFESPLTLAACGGHIEFAKLLLDHGADIEEKDDEGLTPLMEAAREDHIEMVEYLISKGANIHTRTKSDQDVFVLASKHGRRQIVELLVKHGAVVDRETEGGYTALMVAAKLGHYSTVQYLIEQGANVNKTTHNNEETVLSAAVSSGNVHVVHLLLKHNANPHFRLQDGTTMLIEAAKGGHADIAKLLFNWLTNESSSTSSSSSALLLNDQSIDSLTCMNSNLFPDDILGGGGGVVGEGGNARSSMEEYQFMTKDLPNVPVSVTTYNTPACDVTNEQSQGASSSDNSDIDDDDEEDEDYEESECNSDKFIRMKSLYVKQYRNLQQCSLVSTSHQSKWKQQEHKGSNMLALKRQRLKHPKKLFSSSQELRLNDGHHLKHFITSSISPASLSKTKSEKKHIRSNTITLTTTAVASMASTTTTLCGRNHLDHNEDMCGMCGCLKAMKTMEEVDRKNQLDCQTYNNNATPIHHRHHNDDKCCRLHHQSICNIHHTVRPINSNIVDRNVQQLPQQQYQLGNDIANCNLVNYVDQCAPISASSLPMYRPINLEVDAQTLGNQDTALTLSCSRGHVELVCLLLSKGSNFEHRDKKGFTPLLHAANFGHPRIVEILINAGADIEVETERTKDTALSLASANGHAKVVELLIRKGLANIEHRNVSDYTPLCQAASGGHVHVIELLLHYGAEINSRTNSKLGISPLMLAAMNGHAEAVSILLDRGSDVNAQIETNRNTALTLACYQGQHEVVSLLADRKANLEHRAKAGLTPLMEAAQGGFVEVGKILLDRGADVGAIPLSASRDTALGIAAEKGHCAFVELLLSRNAPVDVKNKKGTTALWMACNAGHLDVVKALVNRGADVDSMDNRKVSCLGAALKKGFEKIVKFLVSHVSQLPSDPDCIKLQKSFSELDKPELKNSCMKCLEIIKKAKEAQAMKAYENAAILLDELQQEKKLEAKKRAAREKKREKRKQKKKDRFASGSITPNNNNNDNQTRDSSVDMKAENSSGSQGVSDEDKPEPVRLMASDEEVGGKENNPKCLVTSKSGVNNNNGINDGKKKKNNRSDKTQNSDNNDKNSVSLSNQKDQVKLRFVASSISGLPLQESKVQFNQCPEKTRKDSIPLLKTKLSGIGDLDDFGLLPCTLHTNIVAAPVLLASPGTQKMKTDAKTPKISTDNLKDQTYPQRNVIVSTTRIVSGSSTTTMMTTTQKPLLSTIPSHTVPVHVTYKPALVMSSLASGTKPFAKKKIIPGSLNPSINSSGMGFKKDDMQTFLISKDPSRKMKKVDVPARAVSRVIGRAGCNINAIREFSGAKIDLDKLKTCDDAVVTIRGTNESVNKAAELILALVRESDKDIDQLITAFKQQQLTGGVGLLSSSSNTIEFSTTNVWKTGNSLLKNSITIPSTITSNSTSKETISLIPPNNVWESRKMQNSITADVNKAPNNAWLKQNNNKETTNTYNRPTVISTLNMGGSNVWDNSMADGIGKTSGASVTSVSEDKPEPITTFPIGAWKSVSKSSEIRSTSSFGNDSVPNTMASTNHQISVKENSTWLKPQDPPSTTFSETIIITTSTIPTMPTTTTTTTISTSTTVVSTATSHSESLSTSTMQQFLNYRTNAQSPSLHSYSNSIKLTSSAVPASVMQEAAPEYSPFGVGLYGSPFLNNIATTTSSICVNLIGSLSDITIDKSKAPGYRPPSYQNRSQSPSIEQNNSQPPIYQPLVNATSGGSTSFAAHNNPQNPVNYPETRYNINNESSTSSYQFLLPSEQQQQQHLMKQAIQETSTSLTEASSYRNVTPMVNSTLNPNAPNFNSKPTSISPQAFYKPNLASLYSSGIKYGGLQPHQLQSELSSIPKLLLQQQQQQNIPLNSNDLQLFPNVNPGLLSDVAMAGYQNTQLQNPMEYTQRRFSISEGINAPNPNKSAARPEDVTHSTSVYPSIHHHSFSPYTSTTLIQQQQQPQQQQSYSIDQYRKMPGQLQPIGTERNSKKQLVFNAISIPSSLSSSSSVASPSSSSASMVTSSLPSLVTSVQPSVTAVMSILPKSSTDVSAHNNDQMINNVPSWAYHPGLPRNINPSQQMANAPALNVPTTTYLYNNNMYNSRSVQGYNPVQQMPIYNSNIPSMPANQYMLPNGSSLSSVYHGRLTPQLQQQQHYQPQPPVPQQQPQNSFFYHHSSSYPRFPQEMEGWQAGTHEYHGDELQTQPWSLWIPPENRK